MTSQWLCVVLRPAARPATPVSSSPGAPEAGFIDEAFDHDCIAAFQNGGEGPLTALLDLANAAEKYAQTANQ